MKSELKIISPSLKLTVTLGFFASIIIIVLALTYKFEFSIILLSIGSTSFLIGLLFAVGRTYNLIFSVKLNNLEYEKQKQITRKLTYEADKAQRESYFFTFSKNETIYDLITNTIRANEPVQIIDSKPLALPAPELDLLQTFTQPIQSYAIIGGQQTGKTYQARHIAAYWLNKGIKPIVVGPKWDIGEWEGCYLFGGQGNFSEVSKGIEVVTKEAKKRHADKTKSHKQHTILPVFFDDWTTVIDSVENGRMLIIQASTLFASVNILLYFILHGDTATIWGVDRKGAALKENFIKLQIIPFYENGIVNREKNRGVVTLPGDTNEYQIKLLNGPINYISDNDIIEQDDLLSLALPTDNRILELYQEGQSLSAISQHVYGYKNQAKIDAIKQVLTDAGLIG